MTYPADGQPQSDPVRGPRPDGPVRLHRVLAAGIQTLALYPVTVLACIALMCALDQLTIGFHLLIGGQLSPDASNAEVLHSFLTLTAVLASRVPLDAVIDAGILGAVHAACCGHRPRFRSTVQYVRMFWGRMFIINVIGLVLYVMSRFFCPPLILLAAFYLRFIAVYVVMENCEVGDAFANGTPVMTDRRSRIMPVYLLATLFLVLIVSFMNEPSLDVRKTAISILGDLILGYTDLVVVCTAFFLFNHARQNRGQS
jgi:hypothetical protein